MVERLVMPKLVAITTSRYSTFFRRLLAQYSQNTVITIDGRKYKGDEQSQLLSSWCTNDRIKTTRNFLLTRESSELFGFHDHPSELWAAESERPFLETLAGEKIIKIS
jgi:hypothetical protein